MGKAEDGRHCAGGQNMLVMGLATSDTVSDGDSLFCGVASLTGVTDYCTLLDLAGLHGEALAANNGKSKSVHNGRGR